MRGVHSVPPNALNVMPTPSARNVLRAIDRKAILARAADTHGRTGPDIVDELLGPAVTKGLGPERGVRAYLGKLLVALVGAAAAVRDDGGPVSQRAMHRLVLLAFGTPGRGAQRLGFTLPEFWEAVKLPAPEGRTFASEVVTRKGGRHVKARRPARMRLGLGCKDNPEVREVIDRAERDSIRRQG